MKGTKNFFMVLFILIFGLTQRAYSLNPYCSVPPFIKANLPSNIMLVLDYSGSMSFSAYFPEDSDDPMSNFDSSKVYYGYFIPGKRYEKINGIWTLSNDETSSCQVNCFEGQNSSGYDVAICDATGVCSGSELNYVYMTRIDILRWILTGGSAEGNGCINVKSCEDFTLNECDDNNWHAGMCRINNFWWWWWWRWCDDQKLCNSFITQQECEEDNFHDNLCEWSSGYIETNSGEKINVIDASSYDPKRKNIRGILQQIDERETKPRIGALIFKTSSNGVHNIFERVDLSYGYTDLINTINDTTPNGGTHTKEALEDIKSLFARDNSNYSVDPYTFNGKTVLCAKNFAILMSDGEWRGGEAQTENYDPIQPTDQMWKGGNADLVNNLAGNQNVELYSVAMFQDSNSNGTNSLKWISVYGNYNDLDNNGYPCNQENYPNTSLTVAENLENNCDSGEVQKNKDGTGPYGYYEGKNPEELKDSIFNVFSEIFKQASSATAASVVSTSERSGANILQALFWAKRDFDKNTYVDWSGTMYNLWLYMGPFSSSQEIRENSYTYNENTSNKRLTLQDKVIQFYSDNSTGATKVRICDDSQGSGNLKNCEYGKSISDIKTIWNAGMQLWKTSSDQRKIFTNVSNLTNDETKGNFTLSNTSNLIYYLDVDNLTEAQDIIRWTRGVHISTLRNRLAIIGSQSHVWKLGDIINSTPKILSVKPVNSYFKDYKDKSYYEFNYNRDGSFKHKNRGMVFVGANDGMLHAFRFGSLSFPGKNIIAQLKENGGPFGSEAWAFIPKNILPYLKYMAQNEYGHIYSVDLTPYLFDASIGNPNNSNSYGGPSDDKTALSWRTILIGGLNFGGASGDNSTDAVHPPVNTCPIVTNNSDNGTCIGRSSYFALDVTDSESPKILWEFSDNNTSFTTSGPAIVHIPFKKQLDNGTIVDDNHKNGYWYVVFASGPDKYDGTVHQPLYLYVLDLKTGQLKRKIQLSGSGKLLGNINAFAGRMFNAAIDLGENYSDDALYFGYTYYDNSEGWKGGVIRVNTLDNPDVNRWQVSLLINNIGPVTSAVRELEDRKEQKLWIYFGEGRYFVKDDDAKTLRNIYGVTDPCYTDGTLKSGCSETLSIDSLDNVTNNGNADITGYKGWYITLDAPNTTYDAERLITDPVASYEGWVFFTTFMPTSDICGFGGGTYLWAVNYNNGGTIQNISGKIFLQSSTGKISEIDLSKNFGEGSLGSSHGRRLSKEIKGVPPASGGMTIVIPPTPLDKTMQWLEE